MERAILKGDSCDGCDPQGVLAGLLVSFVKVYSDVVDARGPAVEPEEAIGSLND